MRHVAAKEARDLAPVALVASLAAVAAAAAVAWNDSYPRPGLALLCAAVGAVLGIAQGLLDRRRRDDAFLLHRPAPAARIHAVRGAVGAACAAAVASFVVTAAALTPYGVARDVSRMPPQFRWQFELIPDRMDAGLAGSLACVAAALVIHAVTRLALTARHLAAAAALLVVLPTMVVYAALSVETESPPWVLFAAALAVATALANLNLAAVQGLLPPLRRVRAALLLVVGLFVACESLRYLTTPAWRLQWQVFPQVAVTGAGEIVHWAQRAGPDGGWTPEYSVYGPDRTPGPWTTTEPPVFRACVGTAVLGAVQMEESPLYRAGSYGPPWMRLGRIWTRPWNVAAPSVGASFPWALGAHARWTFEDGRILLRAQDGAVLGGLGPDGWRTGPESVRGESFADAFWAGRGGLAQPSPGEFQLPGAIIDRTHRAAYFIDGGLGVDPNAAPRTAPDSFRVRRVPIEGEGEIGGLRVSSSNTSLVAFAVGRDVVALARDGRTLVRFRIADDETLLATTLGSGRKREPDAPEIRRAVVTTLLAPVAPIGARIRFRVAEGAAPPVTADAVLEPVTAAEHATAWGRRLLAIVRPPVLALASAAAPAPHDVGAMLSAWLLDPLFAGGREPGTLALCLGLGALCGLLARAAARVRRPREAACWTAACALLGPLGLVWMRIVLGRCAVVACACGRRRAVDVETCPGCGAAWPAPAVTGIEVFSPPRAGAPVARPATAPR